MKCPRCKKKRLSKRETCEEYVCHGCNYCIKTKKYQEIETKRQKLYDGKIVRLTKALIIECSICNIKKEVDYIKLINKIPRLICKDCAVKLAI
jgi:hypothetical protein